MAGLTSHLVGQAWKTGFILCLQWAVAETTLSGSLACNSHSGEPDNLLEPLASRSSLSRALVSGFRFSAACGRLTLVPGLLCWETDTDAAPGTMSGLHGYNTAAAKRAFE